MEATREVLLDEKDFMKNLFQGFILYATVSTGVPLPNSLTSRILKTIINTNLSFKDYTQVYDEFLFDAVAVLPKYGLPRENKLMTFWEDGEHFIRIRHNLDVERFQKADRHEALRMIAELLLECVEIYLLDRKDFDGQKFYDDLKPLLLPIIDGSRTFQEADFVL